jgi:uridine phosphorylase
MLSFQRVIWQFDPSAVLVTPQQHLDYIRRRRGLGEDGWRLPPALVGTFQQQAWVHLAARCGIPDAAARGAEVIPVAGTLDGVPVAAVRMMIGAPAAALTLEAAVARGVRDVVIVGSAGSLRDDLPIGSTVLVTGAEREDGTSHHYLPAGEVVAADAGLTDRLEASATARGLRPVRGRAWTIDAPFRETVAAIRRHREAGVLVVEMEAAAMFAVARVRGIRAALIVSISDELCHAEWRPGFDDPRYRESLLSAADAVLACAAGMP